MTGKISRRHLTLLLVSLALPGVSCGKRTPAGEGVASARPASEKPASGTPGITATAIKVGSYGPLSGPAAAWGSVLRGLDAYFKYVNEKGGVHGRKIEFVFRDDQYNPSKTPALVRELVENEGVFALVGGIGTANGRAVADYLEGKDVPFYTPSSGDKFWSLPGKKNVYTGFPRYVSEAEILGRYAAKNLAARKIGVLYQDDDFGKQGVEGVRAGVSKVPGAEVVVEVSCQPTDTDLSGQASQIADKAPDVLILYAAPRQAVAAVKTLEAQRKKPKIVTSFVLSDPILFKLAGATWEGTIAATAGALSTSEEESAKLYREILEKYGGGKLPVGNFTLAGFQYGVPFVEALHRAGRELTRQKFYEALQSFKEWNGPGPSWPAKDLFAPLTYTAERRLGNDKVYLVVAKDGKWEKLTDWMSPGQ